MFEIEPLSSSLRLDNMVGGLGWLRKRVCTCRLGSPIQQTDVKWIEILHFRRPWPTQGAGSCANVRDRFVLPRSVSLSYFIAPGFIIYNFPQVGLIRSAGFCWINILFYLFSKIMRKIKSGQETRSSICDDRERVEWRAGRLRQFTLLP